MRVPAGLIPHPPTRMNSMSTNKLPKTRGLGTRAIHAGQHPDPSTGAIMTPIYATSTYVQQSPGVHKGYEYSRTQNPTRMAYERCVASLEGGVAGFAFASGLAAAATVLDLLDSGSHVIAMDDLYLLGFGPRLGQAAKELCEQLHPEPKTALEGSALDAVLRLRQPVSKTRLSYRSASICSGTLSKPARASLRARVTSPEPRT